MTPADPSRAGAGGLPSLESPAIPGLLVIRLDQRGDSRGWFSEIWQREKLISKGLPDFGPVQQNVSYNATTGTTRGLHAEPWDKYVTVLAGRVFGAWVDLRAGSTYGTVVTHLIEPGVAVFVPRGVANGFQTTADDTVYSYLVNDHWSPESVAGYGFVNLADETLGIDWPVELGQAEMSQADRDHPRLAELTATPSARALIIGAHGQLGTALAHDLPDAHAVGRGELDLADPEALDAWPWREYDTVINAAAYTQVDRAETAQGRLDAWRVNATGVAQLARLARDHRLRLVHISTDYVFDGAREVHDEAEAPSPLGVYGQSKAAGELALTACPRHYLIRTSWVIGAGANFVATMESLAHKGISPSVVDDQIGRLSHTSTLSAAIRHLLDTDAPYGTYNVTDGGPPVSWADVAKAVFTRCGRSPADVTAVDTASYLASTPGGAAAAPRPRNSTLDLTKITAAGFQPPSPPLGSR